MQLGVFIGLFGLVTPYLSKLLIDQVYPSHDVTLMEVIVVGTLTIATATGFVSAIRGYFTLYISTRLSNAISLMFFNHLQHLPIRFFDEHRVGEVTSRFQDVRNSLNTVTNVFQTLFLNGIYLFIVPPFLFFLQWKLALVALAGIPITVGVTVWSGRIIKRYWKCTAEAYAELGAFQVETLSNIRTLKALALENHVFKTGYENTLSAQEMQLKAGGLGQVFGLANSLLRALNTAVFTWYGWTLILTQGMSLGDFIAFSAYVGYLYGPVSQFVNLLSDFQQSSVSLVRMFEYLDHPLEQASSLAYKPQRPLSVKIDGSLAVRNVSFGYTPDKLALEGIELDIPKGGTTAIVGSSGSGKTSLLRLLTGMERPQSGKILIDNRPIEDIPLPDLRRQVSVVWQEVGLLKGTIWENLTIGLDSPSRDTVEDKIRMCRLESLIGDLPKGLETTIAEWGASVSAGQRQRLAIARALMRNAPILILDEATANIDVQTELDILSDLFSRLVDRTIIYVTHRLASASLADQVCVIQGGKIVGCGSHQDLLSSNVVYRQMFSLPTMNRESGFAHVGQRH